MEKLAAHLDDVRSALRTPDRPARRGRSLELVVRRAPLRAEPIVAFLATLSAEGPVVVYPLKPGVNRVGHDPLFGDFEKSSPRVIESRQWILTCLEAPRRAFVADDHSTNQSSVLSRGAPPLGELADPRTSDGPFTNLHATLEVEGTTRLDWRGSRVAELEEGDVLFTVYAPLVFGWA